MSAPASVLNIATPFVAGFEGFVPTAQDDGLGNPTIGYGFIASDFPGGRIPARMTEPQALALLRRKLGGPYYQPLADLMRSAKLALNPYEQAGFLSAIYNLGPGILGDTPGDLLRAHRVRDAAEALLAFSMPGTNVHEGLLRRRKAELALILKSWDPYHYGRFDRVKRRMGAGREADEDGTAREYDAKRRHWLKWPGRLRRLRDNCDVFAARLEAVMEHVDPEGKEHWRKWRHDQFVARGEGKRVVG